MLVLGDEKALAIIAKERRDRKVHDYAVLLSRRLDNNEGAIGAWWDWLMKVKLTKVKLQVQADANVGVGKSRGTDDRISGGARTGTLGTYKYQKTPVFLPDSPNRPGVSSNGHSSNPDSLLT